MLPGIVSFAAPTAPSLPSGSQHESDSGNTTTKIDDERGKIAVLLVLAVAATTRLLVLDMAAQRRKKSVSLAAARHQ